MEENKTPKKQFAKNMRNNPTDEEGILWSYINKKQVHGVKFRRQHVIPPYIVDFVSLELKLIIEVDGVQHHWSEENKRYDNARTKYLEKQGYEVLRFDNDEITRKLDDTMGYIYGLIEKKLSNK